MTTGPLASGGLVAPGPAYTLGSGSRAILLAHFKSALKSTADAIWFANRDDEFEHLCGKLADATPNFPAAQRTLLGMVARNRTCRPARWRDDELTVQFERADRESGEADEVLFALDELLAGLGHPGLPLVAVPDEEEERLLSGPAFGERARAIIMDDIVDPLPPSLSHGWIGSRVVRPSHRPLDAHELGAPGRKHRPVLKPAPAYTALAAKVGSKGKRRQW